MTKDDGRKWKVSVQRLISCEICYLAQGEQQHEKTAIVNLDKFFLNAIIISLIRKHAEETSKLGNVTERDGYCWNHLNGNHLKTTSE